MHKKKSLQTSSPKMSTLDNHPDAIKITPNVFTCSDLKYLVEIDGQVVAFADDEETGIEIVKSLCTSEAKFFEKPGKREVFQRVLDGSRTIQICTRSLGYVMNGGINQKEVITLTAVPKAMYFKNAPVRAKYSLGEEASASTATAEKKVVPPRHDTVTLQNTGGVATTIVMPQGGTSVEVPVNSEVATKPQFVRRDTGAVGVINESLGEWF